MFPLDEPLAAVISCAGDSSSFFSMNRALLPWRLCVKLIDAAYSMFSKSKLSEHLLRALLALPVVCEHNLHLWSRKVKKTSHVWKSVFPWLKQGETWRICKCPLVEAHRRSFGNLCIFFFDSHHSQWMLLCMPTDCGYSHTLSHQVYRNLTNYTQPHTLFPNGYSKKDITAEW